MKFLLISVGTRGDMEPFLAIGRGLKARGHAVICAFPEQFAGLAGEAGLAFASLGSGFLEMLDSDLGRAALGGSGSALSKFVANIRLAGRQKDVSQDLVTRQWALLDEERPDRVLYNGKAVVPVLWEAEHPGETVLISPVPFLHYVKGHAHLAFHRDLGTALNRLSYAMADAGQATTARVSALWLGLPGRWTQRRLRRVLANRRVVYAISPTLFPRQEYWRPNVNVLGYHAWDRAGNWRPDASLRAFLDRHAHDRILFVTFGSMTNPAPERPTRAILDVLLRHGIPAVLNTAAGGLVRPEGWESDLVHFVSEVPYDAIFPRMHAVVHHGGSGTTHMALRAGRATLVVPHIIDQFAWSRIVEGLGVGPEGLPMGKLSAARLEPRILALMGNAGYTEKAESIAARMAREDLGEELYATIVA